MIYSKWQQKDTTTLGYKKILISGLMDVCIVRRALVLVWKWLHPLPLPFQCFRYEYSDILCSLCLIPPQAVVCAGYLAELHGLSHLV